MKLNVYNRSNVINGTLAFVFLSIIFLFSEHALLDRFSLFKIQNLTTQTYNYSYLIIFAGIVFVSIYNIRAYSAKMLLVFGICILAYGIKLLIKDVDKTLIILNSFYSIWLFYFFQVLKSEISESYYDPNFSKYDMFPPLLIDVPCELVSGSGEIIKGNLVNWSENGFFFKSFETSKFKNDRYKVKVNFQFEDFNCEAKLISESNDQLGGGFKIIKVNKSSAFGWDDLYNVFEDLGHHPKALR